MVELGVNQKDVANVLGVSKPTVSQKINNKRPMYLSEAAKLAEFLMINDTQIALYFFSKELRIATKGAGRRIDHDSSECTSFHRRKSNEGIHPTADQ